MKDNIIFILGCLLGVCILISSYNNIVFAIGNMGAGKFVKVSCAGVRFDMLDVKNTSSTIPPIISIIDYRESKWSSDRAYRSVVESFFDEIEKVFKK